MTYTEGAYREVIVDLKRRRDAIDKLISELEVLVRGQPSARRNADMPFQGMKVVDAAKAVLRKNGAPMSPAAITEEIQAGGCEVSSANTVASMLHRYARDNDEIFSPDRGLWGIRALADQDEYVGVGEWLAKTLAESQAKSKEERERFERTLAESQARFKEESEKFARTLAGNQDTSKEARERLARTLAENQASFKEESKRIARILAESQARSKEESKRIAILLAENRDTSKEERVRLARTLERNSRRKLRNS